MAESLALTQEERLQIVSMYATSEKGILAVSADPGWEVLGVFPMRVSADVRLDLLASVSDPSLTLTALLYCISVGFEGEVAGSRVSLSTTIASEQLSTKCMLQGGRLYEIWAEVVGNAGAAYFGKVFRAGPESV